MKRKDFIEKQKAYTLERERRHFDKVIREDKAYAKALEDLYKKTAKDIQETLESLYTRYALSEGVPIEEVKKKVSRMDIRDFEEKARLYAMEKDFSEEASEMLKQYNLKMKVSRLQMMEHEIRLKTIGLADEEEKILVEKLTEDYLKEVERQAGLMKMSPPIREKVLERGEKIINATFHSAKFSDRIWANQRELQASLEKGLRRSLFQGENPRTWARELKRSLNEGVEKATYNATRLAVTETSRVVNEARIESFKAMGYDSYIWVCEPSACHICSPYDEKVFKTEKALIGETQPPMHPNCVCSIAAYYEPDFGEEG